MRDIKFRAWDKKNKKMIYPTIIWNYTEESVNYMFPIFSGIKYDDIDDVSEMMQFTGIIDKNGKEIYEGDIIKTNRYLGTPGRFEDVVGTVLYRSPSFEVEYIKFFGYCELHQSSEVIGNIYENPNLLSEGREI